MSVLIQLDGIGRSYGAAAGAPPARALSDVSLSIREGEYVAIVGASGSGKSTLMHILGCLDRPDSGTYRFEGRDVAALPPDERARLRREAFGFVFQGYHLIPTDSALENAALPALYAGEARADRERRAAALLERLGMGGRLAHRPAQLSGGQQQRVSIARALANGGRVILADEPTGALDTHSGAEVMALFDELSARGHTLILITHDPQVAARARRVIEIRDGRVVADRPAAGAAVPEAAPEAAPEVASASAPARVSSPASVAADAGPYPRAGTRPVDTGGRGGKDGRLRPGHAPAASALAEAWRAAWRSMALNRVRTALTLLGIVAGVASVIVMLAIGRGAKEEVVRQMGALGAAILYVSGGVAPEGGVEGVVTLDDLAAVAELPGIARVMPVIGNPVMLRHGAHARPAYVVASTADLPAIHRWPVAQGRFHIAAENRELAPVVVLGSRLRERLLPDVADPIGQLVLIDTTPFEVIGVMRAKGAESGSASYDDQAFIPFDTGRARVFTAIAEPEYAVVEARSPQHAVAAEAAMRDLLRMRHGRESFGISNAAAKLQAAAESRNAMTLMLGLIAAVSLLVGGIGVMNVMLMTVRERTREIGIRMAVGARQRDIRRQFLTEAALVSLCGGAAGVALGLGIGLALLAAGVELVFSLTALLGAFGCAVATGLASGLMPARAAARLDPVAALSGG
ncbi:ABC transporter permease [Castellaniella defragrans]|uniref:Pyoverdine export ATP-binding/permease protein PvdT n=1 Tax=Castellaniella defragrans TaxID=75697 RepID=A0A7W9TNU3_CASDE|nr:ATP-binding cassette domain-containing protein [Castellaniella defragrans]MBB6084069.1 macrolide transport system ATP-binding/permease protein [Castellaniella defragrans]